MELHVFPQQLYLLVAADSEILSFSTLLVYEVLVPACYFVCSILGAFVLEMCCLHEKDKDVDPLPLRTVILLELLRYQEDCHFQGLQGLCGWRQFPKQPHHVCWLLAFGENVL